MAWYAKRGSVIGCVAGSDLVRLDVGRASAYDVRLDQVAGPDNALRSTGAYSLTVVEAE